MSCAVSVALSVCCDPCLLPPVPHVSVVHHALFVQGKVIVLTLACAADSQMFALLNESQQQPAAPVVPLAVSASTRVLYQISTPVGNANHGTHSADRLIARSVSSCSLAFVSFSLLSVSLSLSLISLSFPPSSRPSVSLLIDSQLRVQHVGGRHPCCQHHVPV